MSGNPQSMSETRSLADMSAFEREIRYVVLKASDLQNAGLTESELGLLQAICNKVDQYRANAGKPDLETVVVEKDWPEYEPTWKAIEQRVTLAAEREGYFQMLQAPSRS